MASRGVSLVYDMGDPATRDQLVLQLVGVLQVGGRGDMRGGARGQMRGVEKGRKKGEGAGEGCTGGVEGGWSRAS